MAASCVSEAHGLRSAPRMARSLHAATLVPLACVLVACGGSDEGMSGDGGGNGSGRAPSRGDLLQSPPALVRTVTTAELLSDLSEPLHQALLLQAGSPLCDVAVHTIEYATVGGAGESTTASGALMVPIGTDANCRGARPIVLYAHGTSTDKTFDLTDLDDAENAEGLYLAAFFAAHGYIVVAPNYAGYDTSTLAYHPYLVADQQSKDMIDALAAARSALPVASASGTTDGGKLFITGYSQGGYVAMATQRAMEAAGMTVTASAPLSGPYALSAFVDAVFAGRVSAGATVQGTFLFTAYQRSLGGVYSSPTQLFTPQYAAGIESLLPSTQPRSTLFEQGLLPRDAFFSLEPPAPQYADITPATTPEEFAPLFTRGFAASGFLIRNEYRLAYLQDAEAHPDGFWPTTTTAEPPVAPALPLRRALKSNDLRNWTPRAPALLCGGHDDPTVFWLNTQAIEAYWASHAPGAPYTVLDVDAASTGDNDRYGDLKHRFGLAKDLVAAAAVAQGATDGGFEAVLENYHAGLVAPFCLEAARELFSGR
jgi:hypothetical protein